MHTSGGLGVVTSVDAGGFYCEHCLAVAGRAGDDVGHRVDVGFLHVPPYRADADDKARAAHRRQLAEVVAVAIDGFVRQRRLRRLSALLTGYEAWGIVAQNPSGDVVNDANALHAALAARDFSGVGDTRARGASGLQLTRVVLPVDDRAIDGGPQSVQAKIATCAPHVALCLGVHSDSDRFRVERRATDRRLRLLPTPAHDEARPGGTVLFESDALIDAIVRGARPRRGARRSRSRS